jgi:hypothetical protein
MMFALVFRDFSVIKAIFLYPAALSFPVLFLRAADQLSAKLSGRNRWIMNALQAGIVLLISLYATDVYLLVPKLAPAHLLGDSL